MKLEQIITIKMGKNQSRKNEHDYADLSTYSYEDLMKDLDGAYLDSIVNEKESTLLTVDPYLTTVCDVVFSFVSSVAGIVSIETQGKVMNQNFAKLIIDTDKLDKHYLCYVLNESQFMKKQMAVSMQGSTVPKLTPGIFRGLEVPLPSIEKQKMIGRAYFHFRKRQALMKKQAKLEEQLFLEVLKQHDQ
ncbi:restriction endonuclease subunit S [Bacillus altitudinis]|uniref:restriction endonuclease subunit S n=1 Tax=Bacillus altitudinis TaxID=293387 RepID=UPI0002BDA045|nr:restriction endonuclease subunit S [Bacillus altitudinis]EMI12621.1 type i restriction-modification system specificity subunit [Bacillus stratosphericus LAMA 585]MBV5113773.1 restriction endonuclease subunit S [Bacillus altitudinis]MBW2729970.1 restriction endonuclease subunit S [Bacillus altitudinis]QAR51559.1 restriction endonuclease subunit S [Bacillus aerophilus]